ncbi:MAG: hypothetical protein KF729_01915 [Sandaracinaceae bacterium]|nr:hypothetical protein [Sandaracinaceae bacterium]
MNVGNARWDVISFVALNIAVDGTLTEVFVVVRNDGPVDHLCSPSAEMAVMGEGDRNLGTFYLSFDGQVQDVLGIALTCIPPGQIGIGYGNTSGAVAVGSATEIRYVFNGDAYSSARPWADVRNEGSAVVDPFGGGSFWALRGALRHVSGNAIRNPEVTVLPMVDGLPIARLQSIELVTVRPGDSLAYTTTSTETRFVEYLAAIDYRAPPSVVLDTPELRAAVASRDRRAAIRDANAARRGTRL